MLFIADSIQAGRVPGSLFRTAGSVDGNQLSDEPRGQPIVSSNTLCWELGNTPSSQRWVRYVGASISIKLAFAGEHCAVLDTPDWANAQ